MKKLLLLVSLMSAASVFAQQKWININTHIGGTMITFSLYQKQTDNSYLMIDSRDEDSGIWTFDSLDAGIYRVHMSMAYAKYIPTWHPMKAIWEEASDIDLTTADSALCHDGMLANPAFTGPGSISGELTEGLLKTAGEPLKNVRVVIKNASDVLVKMTSTNDSGTFTASNLPVGSYKILVDMVNVPTANAKTVVLDSSNLTATVDLTVNAGGTVNTGLNEGARLAGTTIVLYPNPVADQLFINTANYVKITIYSIQGVQVKEALVNNQTPLLVNDLPKGIYVASLVAEKTGETTMTKFVKE